MRVIAIAIAAFLMIPIGIYMELVYPEKAIRADLEADGVSNIDLSWRMFSGTIFTRCNDKHATVRSFTGIKNGQYVEGVACYTTFLGATHWTS